MEVKNEINRLKKTDFSSSINQINFTNKIFLKNIFFLNIKI